MSIDPTLSTTIQTHILSFLISAFHSLDNGLVRKECAPLVSISIWNNLASDSARERKFEQHAQLRKAWRAASKRYDAADEASKAKLRFERAWLFSMLLGFVSRLDRLDEGSCMSAYYISADPKLGIDNLIYCERFLELLTDLESQLPTRRYVNTLLKDLHLLALIKTSPIFNDVNSGLFRDLFVLFRHFLRFPVDDNSGVQKTQVQTYEEHCANLTRLQRVALKHFKQKLTILALSNFAAIDRRDDLETHLTSLIDTELAELCSLLGFRTKYPPAAKQSVSRELLLEVLVSVHERRKTFREAVRDLSILPTEAALYEPTLLRNEHYNGSRSLAIPKLNLQYLTVGDFLWRSFVLYRCESFFEIRKDMEETVKRLQPRGTNPSGAVRFDGFSRMAIPISKPA